MKFPKNERSSPTETYEAPAYLTRALNEKPKVTRAEQWKVWFACALQAFWVMGINQSFGIFQAYYGSDKAVKEGVIQPEDQMERAGIAAIQSLGNGGIVAVFAIFFYPYLPCIGRHIRTLCFASTVLAASGFAAAAACNNIWLLVVTQGLLVGIGNGFFLNVLTAILPEYFGRRSGAAQGAAAAFGCVGAVILSLVLHRMLDSVGSRWTLGTLSIASMCILGSSSYLAQPPRKCHRRSAKLVGWKTFKNPTFTLLFLANFIHPMTVAIPTTFGPEFSKALGYSGNMASIILAVSSAVGIPSRFLLGWAADFVGHNNMLFLAIFIFALSTLIMWLPSALADSGAVWMVYKVVYGCVFGTFTALINSVQKGHFGDELYYPYNGAMTSIRGIGYVVGVPVAGLLVSRAKGSELHGSDFVTPIAYTGIFLMVSVLCLAGVRYLDAKKNGWKWVK
ncbi:MFS general substrate transporter [Bimuria novae-zelandiae CBS 107.79]|uniref:MFS general substrate transporter n=1 Tax=Bimuria novae-zelandiae CBS 107.79 TaxID=1447943 RepID=A0A6A5VT93_9PLEO|nr:MFS general substrate transporter [Bimuria novae-zelandiae CBS 107.79]